jgi:hypothetical protein
MAGEGFALREERPQRPRSRLSTTTQIFLVFTREVTVAVLQDRGSTLPAALW